MNLRSNSLGSLSQALAAALAAVASASALAQSYTVIDLTPTAGNAIANSVEGGVAVGYEAPLINSALLRAKIWAPEGTLDLHPAILDNPLTGIVGRSGLEGSSGDLQVGWGAGPLTSNRTAPMAWRSTADSAGFLPLPFTSLGGLASSTDGNQIVGYAVEASGETPTSGTSHALVWDAATSTVTDLGDGGKGARAVGVSNGQQVGYITKANAQAALWTGTENSLVVLHPAGAAVSVANTTDGSRQGGYAGYDVRVRNEARKGNKYARFTYATVWTGTANSALSIHPSPSNAPAVPFNNSYVLGMQGAWMVGYATDPAATGSPAYNHAIVWDAEYQSIDLNAFLPAGFTGAIAYSVDADGTVAGVMTSAAGKRHAVLWVPTPSVN